MTPRPNFHGYFDSRFIDGKDWLVLKPFYYADTEFGEIHVPQLCRDGRLYGFVTDGASIPRPFWSIVGTPEQFDLAAVIHDWLYVQKLLVRTQCDRVLLRALRDMGSGSIRSRVMYDAVRTAGGAVWNRRPGIDMSKAIDSKFDFMELLPDLEAGHSCPISI